jgi:RHS repeat-associated protein
VRLTTTKDHDNINRLRSISSSGSGFVVSSHAYLYNNANQRTRATLRDGSYWEYQYDALGQVKWAKKRWPDNVWVPGQQFEYVFDDIGNRTSTKVGGDSAGAALRAATYSRNLLNQYSSRTVPNAIDVLGVGNRDAIVMVNNQATWRRGEYYHRALTVANSSAPVNQAVTVTATLSGNNVNRTGNVFVPQATETYTPDLDGNLIADNRWNYTWDAENRLIRMVARTAVGPQQRIDFEYDFRGRRIGKKVWNNTAGTGTPAVNLKFLYDGWNLVAEVDGNAANALLRSYMWGLDLSGQSGSARDGAGGVGGLLAFRPATGAAQFAAYDGNGNVTALVDGSNGSVTAEYEYGAFGELIRSTGTQASANPVRFSSKFTDYETDLVYYGYRFYNPSTGRWLSRDPIEEEAGSNLFAAYFNEPITTVDRNGLDNWSNTGSGQNSVGRVTLPILFPNPSTGDNTSAYGLFGEWLGGLSPGLREFTGNDKLADQMRQSPEAIAARNRLKRSLQTGCKKGLSEPFSRNLGAEGMAGFYAGFVRDTLGRNPARAFMGSFSGNATIVSCFACCAIVKFTASNTAGWESATRMPPPYGYDTERTSFLENPSLRQWPRSALPDNAFGPIGRNVIINISWQELICP